VSAGAPGLPDPGLDPSLRMILDAQRSNSIGIRVLLAANTACRKGDRHPCGAPFVRVDSLRESVRPWHRNSCRRPILAIGMKRIVTWLVFVVWLLPAAAGADQQPAKGKLLVATELVRGDVFAKTVILLLHYDENGAMGIVVNRPTDIELEELIADVDAIYGYSGAIYWGGPVQMNGLRALLRTDTPPKGAEAIVDSVHLVRVDDGLEDTPADLASLRFFIGYAGWDAGQLDREMGLGSWHVVPASDEHVFADDPRALWKRLSPPREYRATAQSSDTLGLRLRN